MKQVKILQDGSYGGYDYKKGEIWNVVNDKTSDYYWTVERDGCKTVVGVSDLHQVKKEAELIQQLPIFN